MKTLTKTRCLYDNKDLIILESLLTQPTIKKAAALAGVSESTIYNRLKDPEFLERYREAQREQAEHITQALKRVAQLAVSELENILTSPSTGDAERIRAAETVLRNGVLYSDYLERLK